MSIIDKKLIHAYAVMVLAERYILEETDREHDNQKLVSARYKDEVGIKVAERTIEVVERTMEILEGDVNVEN